VVPRRANFGEAVDDHQLQLGRRLGAAGLVTFIDSPRDLGSAIEVSPGDIGAGDARGTPLADDLRTYFRAVLEAEENSQGVAPA
jgi:UDP-N-acetylglucosamine transferase subunit ALG13